MNDPCICIQPSLVFNALHETGTTAEVPFPAQSNEAVALHWRVKVRCLKEGRRVFPPPASSVCSRFPCFRRGEEVLDALTNI